jgi:hypothetical protein
MPNPYITIKITNKADKMVQKVASRKSKRIFNYLQAGKFKDCTFSVCVNYGKGFKNEGTYNSKKYLIFALKAFLEKD